MVGHKLCFYGEIWLIIPQLSLLPLLIWSTGLKKEFTTKEAMVFSCYYNLFQKNTLLTLLHSKKAKIVYNFGLSDCNRVVLAFLSAKGLRPLICFSG